MDGHFGEYGCVCDVRKLDAVGAGVADYCAQREQFWHVAAGFARHPQVPKVSGFPAFLVVGDGPGNISLAGVIRAQRVQPVAIETFLEYLQIVQCGVGCGIHVAPAIVPPVLLQTVAASSGRDELPHARGAARRVGKHVERAFHDRQQCQFARQAAQFDLRDNEVQIRPRAVDDALQVVRV